MFDNLISPGITILEKSDWFNRLGLETQSLLKLVFIECRKNLSIIDALNFDGENILYDSPAFILIAKQIQYDSIELLLSGSDKANKTFDKLSAMDMVSKYDEDINPNNAKSES